MIVIANIEISKLYFVFEALYKWVRNFGVEHLCALFALLKRLELANECLVLCKVAFKHSAIKYKPLVNVGYYEVANLQVAVGNAFAQVVEQQFVHRFGVQFPWRNHLPPVAGALCLYNHPHCAGPVFAIVNNQIGPLFGVDKVIVFVIRIFQKIANQVLVILFRLTVIYCIEQLYKVGLKNIYLLPIWL